MDGVLHEIPDCVQVLETPVGNATFCKKFISKAMSKVQEHSRIILDQLPSKNVRTPILQVLHFTENDAPVWSGHPHSEEPSAKLEDVGQRLVLRLQRHDVSFSVVLDIQQNSP